MIRRFLSAALLAALLGGSACPPALAGERVVRVSVVSQLWRDDDRTVEAGWMVELDRCYGLKGADILFTPTQSWGPDALYRDLRDISRAMDYGLFLVECTHPSSDVAHRSMIVEPTGQVVARSEYQTASVLSAIIDLDKDRPLRYLPKYTPYKPGGYLPEYQPDQMPASANDLRETILSQRRPSLYGVILDVRPPTPAVGQEALTPHEHPTAEIGFPTQ
jgi:hypothetical protein